MSKLSIEEAKNIKPADLLKIIDKAKKYLKKNDTFKEMCKEFDLPVDIIDVIPVKFGDLDVSARTAKGIITLNYKLLTTGNFEDNYHYLLHESQHILDQCFGDTSTKGANEGDYLKNPDEQSAFKKQIKFIDEEHGEEEAENYVEHLLDHHDKDGKDRNNLKETLMEEVDE